MRTAETTGDFSNSEQEFSFDRPIMKFDVVFLDKLSMKARESARLRMNFDLRDSQDSGSQRMLNALEPGTDVPVHRHRGTNEVVSVLRGRCLQHIYDDNGNLRESVLLEPGGKCPAMLIEKGIWHRIESLESGTVILESKEGAWEPLSDEDIY